MKSLRSLPISFALTLLAACLSQAANVVAYSRAYGPQKEMRIARPTLRWEVWPADKGNVTSVQMLINGRSVPAQYNKNERAVVYTPSSPFSPGSYQVNCKVQVDQVLQVQKSWKFSVSENAALELPTITNEQIAALNATNRLRDDMGLEPMKMDPRLAAAALSHSKYLQANNRVGHYQKEGEPGFLAVQPSDRLEAYGFFMGSWECVNSGTTQVERAVQDLFDAPYHRLPFMQPGPTVFGAGFTGKRLTLEFGISTQQKTTVSPYPGQNNVPLGWSQIERPDPLRMHTSKRPVGYPIVYSYFSSSDEEIVVESAQLKTQSGEVPVFLNTPANDSELHFSAFIIPQKPLQPLTQYWVQVKAHTKDGIDISRSWNFSTGSNNMVAKNR